MGLILFALLMVLPGLLVMCIGLLVDRFDRRPTGAPVRPDCIPPPPPPPPWRGV